MIYGSVCSGVEAATVAWHGLGWKPAWFCEFEKFPSQVLAHHYPDVPNLGDMTKIEERPEYNDRAINLLVGGTPCQSFSIAGLRKGLADDRGNLALKFCEILRDKQPEFFLWENVPGVLSSNQGRDFAAILSGFRECGYGFAYRILDAQYFGVPQRRRRVFVVGHLGDWRHAAAVLFERDSLRRDFTPRREAGQEVAGTFKARARSGGWGQDVDLAAGGYMRPVQFPSTGDTAHCLNAGGMGRQDYETETMIAHTLRGEGFDASEDGTGRGTPLVPVMDAIGFSCKDSGNDALQDQAPTLRAMNHSSSHPNGGGQVAVSVSLRGRAGGGTAELTEGAAPALRASQGGGDKPHVLTSAVRRLTPRECERLQGFPDDYTLIPINNRGGYSADGPRYKAMGNSMAVPVMRWLGERIQMVDNLKKEGQR
jgi:DNA (cytosine-5)-methyltransferase 1